MIAYDIEDDRNRRRAHDLLKDYGERVQYSLFECWLDDSELAELKTRLERLIDPDEDHVRYYPLCPKDLPNIQLDGGRAVAVDSDYHLL